MQLALALICFAYSPSYKKVHITSSGVALQNAGDEQMGSALQGMHPLNSAGAVAGTDTSLPDAHSGIKHLQKN